MSYFPFDRGQRHPNSCQGGGGAASKEGLVHGEHNHTHLDGKSMQLSRDVRRQGTCDKNIADPRDTTAPNRSIMHATPSPMRNHTPLDESPATKVALRSPADASLVNGSASRPRGPKRIASAVLDPPAHDHQHGSETPTHSRLTGASPLAPGLQDLPGSRQARLGLLHVLPPPLVKAILLQLAKPRQSRLHPRNGTPARHRRRGAWARASAGSPHEPPHRVAPRTPAPPGRMPSNSLLEHPRNGIGTMPGDEETSGCFPPRLV